ncbi:MAG: permease of phosphate ABC transporter [Eubacteriales bacterium]
MLNLFSVTERYCQNMNLQKFALVKICILSAGALIGLCSPEKYKKPALMVASCLFALTYIPVMMDFFKSFKTEDEEMYL